jgi:His-Xaa-Ser system protein HxsD
MKKPSRKLKKKTGKTAPGKKKALRPGAKTKAKPKAGSKAGPKARPAKSAARRKAAADAGRSKPRVSREPIFESYDMDRVVVPVDKTVYPLDAIYGAAYVFLDRAYVYLEKEKENTVRVSLASKTPADRDALMALGGEFVNELLNQAIRANLDDGARKIREYIVVKSHYGQPSGNMDIEGLLDQTLKEAFDEDPLDIAVPWEEKYGKGKDKGK